MRLLLTRFFALALLPAAWSCTFDAVGLNGFQFEAGEQNGFADAHTEAVDSLADADKDDTGQPVPCSNDAGCVLDADAAECVVPRCVDGFCKAVPSDSHCAEPTDCASWTCDAKKGCVKVPTPDKPCTPLNQCLLPGTCNAEGECTGSGPVVCQADTCYEPWCDPDSGCQTKPLSGPACDDSDPCTSGDACAEGVCKGTLQPDACPCKDDSECTQFDDADKCNGSMACIKGTCQLDPDTIVTCPQVPGVQCVEKACDKSTGDCYDKSTKADTPCEDGNPCTLISFCDGQGQCVGTAAPDGTTCDLDADKCTLDACEAGTCAAGPTKSCSSGSPCVLASCNPGNGACDKTVLDAVPCDDNDGCTVYDECKDGFCEGVEGCADCKVATNSGRLCTDGNDNTVGDFCFGSSCTGFKTQSWIEAQDKGTAFSRVTYQGTDYSLLGTRQTNAPDPLGKFVKFVPGNPFKPDWPYDPKLVDIDGRVAVGPAKIYYFGQSWSASSHLWDKAADVCPELNATGFELSAVAHRESPDSTTGASGESVLMGLSAVDEPSESCLLVSCNRASSASLWSCSAMAPFSVLGNEDPPMPLHVTAIRLPPPTGSCPTPAACVSKTNPIYVALSSPSPMGTTLGIRRGFTGEDGKLTWDSVANVEVPGQLPVEPRILALSVDSDLNLFAAGTNRFLFAKPAGANGSTIKANYMGLEDDETHFYGVYHDKFVTVIATTRISKGTGQDAKATFRLGALTGSAGLLLTPGGTEEPFFAQAATFTDCLDCLDSPLGLPGITDLAVNLDHMVAAPVSKPVLVLSGTVHDTAAGKPWGTAFVLAP